MESNVVSGRSQVKEMIHTYLRRLTSAAWFGEERLGPLKSDALMPHMEILATDVQTDVFSSSYIK